MPAYLTSHMQERELLRQAVDKLALLEPDVLLVGHSVAREAQDALLQRNISLALNVKRSMLDRLARCTGAQVRRLPIPTLTRAGCMSAPPLLGEQVSLPPPEGAKCTGSSHAQEKVGLQVAESLDQLSSGSVARCQEFKVEHVPQQVRAVP